VYILYAYHREAQRVAEQSSINAENMNVRFIDINKALSLSSLLNY